mgnify:CR=1 FL=1
MYLTINSYIWFNRFHYILNDNNKIFIMKKLFGLILIIILISCASCRWIKEKGIFGRKADTMAVWLARQDSLRIADSIKAVQEKIAIEKEKFEADRLAEEQKLEWARKYKYNIIVGSFITPEYARNLLTEYQALGYKDARLIPLENTRFEMVAVEAHDNLRTALTRLERFRDTVAFDSWIYVFRK